MNSVLTLILLFALHLLHLWIMAPESPDRQQSSFKLTVPISLGSKHTGVI